MRISAFMIMPTNYPAADSNSLMDYTDDGDSESEVLGPVQESQQTLHDPTSDSEPPELPPSYEGRMQPADPQRAGGTQAACSAC